MNSKTETDAEELKKRYETFAKTLDYRTTAADYNLRELEIQTGAEYMADGMKILDVGCGLGYAPVQYATRYEVEAHGIDYAGNMIKGGEEILVRDKPDLRGSVTLQEASVLELPFEDNQFDVITSSRCLMALLDWNLQQDALREIHRVLKPGGVLVFMEGTHDGLNRLNDSREKFGLDAIAADGRDRLITLKFDEKELCEFCVPLYSLERIKRFGMYYFLTRVVQPLLVAPEAPSYDHKLNEVAKQIAEVYPDFEGLGHLVAFVFSKRR